MHDYDSERSLHDVLSSLLVASTVGIGPISDPVHMSYIRLILSVFRQSRLKAEHAHEIARIHNELPATLRRLGHEALAQAADDTLADMQGRVDKKDNGSPASATKQVENGPVLHFRV